jgi:transcriptional regulator with GAF, ATPase, and Fis domain
LFIGQIIADSPEMKAVLAAVERVAPANASVVIQGETGVGKGLIAKVIHRESRRADKPFMHLNCSALTELLLESELFGHEKGAFTGATAAKPGLFEIADGGTLFLDEVSEMSRGMQSKLLQVLDTGELRRVGGTTLREVDVRILAASNKDLKLEVRAGRFRNDLLFRLKVVLLRIPPLRQRREDIPGLVTLYIERFSRPRPARRISAKALESLRSYNWPGNVRELANTIEHAVLLAPGDEIRPADVIPHAEAEEEPGPEAPAEPMSLAEAERLAIRRALQHTGGKKAPAARLLGINVKTLSRKIQTYNIPL